MFIKNKKGLVILEAIPLIWVMFVLMGATLGSWGIAHTAALNSIAARNYIFFLFNNRADLSYLRDFSSVNEYPSAQLSRDFSRRYFKTKGERFSYINKEGVRNTRVAYATQRPVSFGKNMEYTHTNELLRRPVNSARVYREVPDGGRNKKRDARGKAWIMVGYGICLCACCDNGCDSGCD